MKYAGTRWRVTTREVPSLIFNLKKLVINGVFTGVFTCRCVACEDAGRAAYSQLHLHVTGKYYRQQTGISCQTTEMLHAVLFTHSESQCLSTMNMQQQHVCNIEHHVTVGTNQNILLQKSYNNNTFI